MDPIRKYIIQQIIKQTGKIPRATTLIDNAVAQLKIRLKNAGQDISKITDSKQITQFFNKEKSLWNQNIKRAADAAPKNILKGPQKKPFSGWTPKVVEKSMRPSDYAVLKEEWFGKIIANTDDAVNTFLKKGIDKADNRFLNFSKTQRKDFLDMIDYRLKHGNKKFMNDFTDAAGKFKFPENLAGGGIAGMLGEPTYEDDNHRVPLKDGSWKPPLPDENWMESWWKNLGPWEKISVFGWGLPFEKGGRVPDEDARLLNQLPTQELQIGPYIPELGHKEGFEDNYIEFDDGTVYYKDLGEFYDQEGTQVTSPSAGARPVGEILEAAEGGRVGLAGGGLPAALRLIMQKYGKDAIKLAKDVKTSKKWDTQKAIQEFKKRNPQFKAEGGRVPMWMGGGFKAGKGLLRLLMRHLSKEGTTGLKGSDLLKLTNTKQYHNMLNRPEGIPTLAKEMIEKYSKDMKVERINSVKQALDMAKKMKTAKDKTLAMDKITEGMTKKYVGEGMDEGMVRNLIDMFIKAKYPDYSKVKAIKDLPNVTSQGILELENILKNLATKGRKLNASGGIARLGYTGGKIVKGAAWVIKNLKKQLSQFEKEDFMGKLSNISSMEKNAFKNEINTLIKQLEKGKAIPQQMLETMRKDKRFKDVIKTKKIKEQIKDSELRELEEVLLDYGKNVKQKEILKQFDVTGLKKHAFGGRVSLSSGGVAGMLGE